MIEKTKNVAIDGKQYQLRRFTPDVGSYIVMQILGAGMKSQTFSEAPPSSGTTVLPPEIPAVAPNGEDVVRTLVFAALLRGMDFDMHKKIQDWCLACCSRMEGEDGKLPMPLTTQSGAIMGDVRDDMPLVMKLEMEVLVFNFSDFFAEGGLNTLAGPKPPVSKA